MRIAFTIIWTFGICFGFGYFYASTFHRRPSTGLLVFVSLAAWLSALGIVYLWHKAKKDSGEDTPSSWL